MAHSNVPVSTLAKLFNLTTRRIQQLAADGIIPKAEKGKYDLMECTQCYVKYLQERAAGRDIEPLDGVQERTRLLKAQADKTELEVKAMNGEVIPTEQAELLWSGLVAAFRAKILAMPSRCSLRLMNLKTYPEIEGCLRDHAYEALTELSRYDPQRHSILDIEESGEPGSAAAEPENQPMGGSIPAAE